MDVVALGDAVDFRRLAEWVFVAGSARVDEMLHDGGVHHRQRRHDEAKRNSADGLEGDVQLAQDRVHAVFQDGDEDDNGDGVKVLHQVVGNTVALHLAGLRHEVARELAVDNPVDWVEGEHLASDQRPLDFLHKPVVPADLGSVAAVRGLPAGLGGIHVAVAKHNADDAEGVGDDGSLRGPDNVELSAEEHDGSSDAENSQAKQEGRPEANVALHVGRGQQGQRAEVDAAVEDHVDALHGDRRIDDDARAVGLGLDGHLPAPVLFGDQGSDVTLDTSGAQSDDDQRDNKTAETGAMLQRHGQRRQQQDQKTNDVNSTEEDNSLVFAEILVCNDGTDNGGNCCNHQSYSRNQA